MAGGTTEEVAGKQMESFAAQMDVVKSQINDAGVSIGEKLAPAFLSVAKGIGEAAEFIGPLLGGLFKLVGFAVKLTPFFHIMKGVGAILKTAAAGVGELEARLDPAKKPALELGKALDHISEALEDGVSPATAFANGVNHLARTGTVSAEAITELGMAAGATRGEIEEALRVNIEWARSNGVAADQIKAMESALLDEIKASDRSGAEKRELAFALGLVEQGASDLELAELGLIDSAEGMGGAASDAAGEMSDLEGEVMTLADALAVAEENQTSLATAMREFADPTFAAISAVDKLRDAQANLEELQEEGEATSEELAEAQIEIAKAVLEAQGALDEFSAGGIDEQVGVIAAALGISDEAARDLLETLGLIDGKRVEATANVVFTAGGSTSAQNTLAAAGSTTLTGALARQHGGDVRAGHPYMVGERGRELFIPGQSGAIISNQDLAGITNNNNQQRQLTVIFRDSQLKNDPVQAIRTAFARDALQGPV
jgi:hypothetical protein